jgi:uncharacterized protein
MEQVAVYDIDLEQPIAETEWIWFKRSRVHGTGGFAKTGIPAGTRLIEYVGERIDKQESSRRCEADNEFIFTLDENWDLDGSVEWNLARFINHSCAPNCDAESEDDDRIWIVANRDIQAGEELTFNYGYDLEDYKEHPCCCGAAECVGYIVAEEYFEQVRRQREAAHAAAQSVNGA